MLEESLAVGEDTESNQVTAIISHIVRPGRSQGYEEWFHGIAAAAHRFKGYLGVNAIRPRDQTHPEYVHIVRFDHYNNLKKWLESDIRREWIERLQPLIEKPETLQTLTGLETWFSLSDAPMKSLPPRYKIALITWLGVFITLTFITHLLAPLLSRLPVLLNQLITTGLVVAFLTYLLMPRLTQLFRQWLYPKALF
jgi:uncharacterized protein